MWNTMAFIDAVVWCVKNVGEVAVHNNAVVVLESKGKYIVKRMDDGVVLATLITLGGVAAYLSTKGHTGRNWLVC